MKPEYIETPTEADFPLIDRCVVCECTCDWQPRYEMAMRDGKHFALLASRRKMSYTPEHRVVKICASCTPDSNVDLKRMIWQYYPVYAALHPSKFGRKS